MDFKESYKLKKRNHPDKFVFECLEFNVFFAFALVDNFDDHLYAGGYYTIDKNSVRESSFNPAMNLDLLKECKRTDISELE